MTWRLSALALLAVFAAALVWLAGFTAFERAARLPRPEPLPSDGIVALTGGADRIETALNLFAEGKAPRLLVSGVGGGTDLTALVRHRAVTPALDGITLGRTATDTVGNAAETAAWARQHDIRTLIVVTAGYHMPRALTEIARALPGVELRPVPVRPLTLTPTLNGPDPIGALRLLAIEYDKFLAVSSGINRAFASILSRGARP